MEGVCCWWCCHRYESETLKLPYHYDYLRNKYVTEGSFCSWSCMKSYAINKYGVNKGGIICGNIITMRKKMYNIIGSVRMAPNRYMLKMFGGPMTIEEFRENTQIDKAKPKQLETIEKVDRLIPIISNTKNKMSEIKNATGSNDTLKLKRNKPLKREQNDLGAALGLIVKPKT